MDKKDSIFILVFVDIDKETFLIRARNRGWYTTKEDAVTTIKKDGGWLNEDGYYPYIVIEEMSQGVLQVAVNEFWYDWDDDLTCYVETSKPNQIKNVISFWE